VLLRHSDALPVGSAGRDAQFALQVGGDFVKEVEQMKYRWTFLAFSAVVLGALVGCGGPEEEEETPAQAVAHFLDAVRRGDDQAATAMFTPLAREKANEIGLAVAPRGSDTATFEVGKTEYPSESTAHVQSTWSDLGEDGQRHSDAIQWSLEKLSEGWRVAGMTATVFPGEPPLELSFEDPEEMLRKLDALRTEMARRNQQPTSRQASQPEVSEDSFRR
jgi:hypothetical protein